MAERIHLGTIDRSDGTIWYTLIVESPTRFHVEQYNDSIQVFLKERLTTIPTNELGRHVIGGISLATLVADKFKEKNFQGNVQTPPRSVL